MVSEIVLGGDPIAPDNRRHAEVAFERGLNYFDTAPAYGGGKSEEGYAEALRAVGRQNVFLTTKVSPLGPARNRAYQQIFASLDRARAGSGVARGGGGPRAARGHACPSYLGNYFRGQLREVEEDALSDVLERRYRSRVDGRATYHDTIVKSVEESLRRMKTDYVDILFCPHGASSYAETQIPEVHEAYQKLKADGKVRALGRLRAQRPGRRPARRRGQRRLLDGDGRLQHHEPPVRGARDRRRPRRRTSAWSR